MAPRRNHHAHGHGPVEVQGLGIDPETIENHDASMTRCCVPSGDCLREYAPISMDDLSDVVKVTCNNDHCHSGQYMHRECFDAWEQTVLTYLKTCGRARSWSERQRHQNLWTKKGYDLAFKACGCLCGRGHLKKDLDWMPPMANHGNGQGVKADDDGKKKKRRNRQNTKPTLAVSAHHHPNNNNNNNSSSGSNNNCSSTGSGGRPTEAQLIEPRGRTGSLSSSTGSSSPPVSASSEPSVSPVHSGHNGKKKSKFEFFSDRARGGAANGIFARRLDFSSFNSLPKHKLNSYHIKMEDEGNHGNDETRCFILSTLAAVHAGRVACLLCSALMPVFDRYPLLDGTFFLSPKQHNKHCIEVKAEGRAQFLSAVCMACLEGWGAGRSLRCRHCATPWDGSSLVLGTMYSYDIFAAMACCPERSRCNNCQKPLLHPHQRLNFYSDYSHKVPCPHCGVMDTHFVKPLGFCYSWDKLPSWS